MTGVATLGAEPSSFVGRTEELARLELVVRAHRLVTVVGPSGIGKSRLLRKLASSARAAFAGGVVHCDVRRAHDIDDATALVLRAVGGEERTASEPVRAVERILAARGESLLVLDDVDALRSGFASLIARWLSTVPELRVLCAGRAPVFVEGSSVHEERFDLGPMRTDAEAVDLAVERVRGARASFAPTDADRVAIAEVARRLHGVPLAIELAAARLTTAPPSDVLARIAPLSGTTSDPASAFRRAIDRAWTLLDPIEREVLCQLAVFRGSFGMDAAATVVQLPLEAPAASEVALSLARKGLLEICGVEPLRMTMAESLRSHAEEILESNGRGDEARYRHLRAFDDLAARAAGLDGASTLPAAQVAADRENLLAACDFASSAGRPDLVLRLALALDVASLGGGLGRAALSLLDSAIASGGTRDPSLLGKVLAVRASTLHSLGRLAEARADAETALSLAKEGLDWKEIANRTRVLANAAAQLGDLEQARTGFLHALALERDAGHREAVAGVLQQLGGVLQTLGDHDGARIHLESSLALSVELDDPVGEARACISLGSYWLEIGDHTRARRCYERGIEIARRVRMARAARIATAYLGVLCFDAGELDRAEELLRTAARASGDAGDLRVEGIFEGIRGAVLASLGRVREARASFALAEEALAANSYFAEVIAIHRGHLDLAEARIADLKNDHDLAESHRVFARLRLEDAYDPSTRPDAEPGLRPIVTRSDDARIAARILERAIAAAEG